MPKGRSFSSDNWQSFEKGAHSFTEDGFVHDKTLAFKARLENEKDGVDIHENIIEKTEGLSGAGEIKFWFATDENRSVYARIGSATNLNLQFDNGVRALRSISHNLYGGMEVNRSLTEKIGKVGLELFKDGTWSFNTRLIFNFTRKNFSLDQKGAYSWKNWKLNAYTNAQFANHFTLNKTGVLLTWTPAETTSSLFFKFERSDGEKKTLRTFFEQVVMGWNKSLNEGQTIGIETKFNLSNASWRHLPRALDTFWLASSWKLGEATVKARINKDLSHAVSITNKMGVYGQYSLGVEMTEVGSKNRFKFGTQIDLNL